MSPQAWFAVALFALAAGLAVPRSPGRVLSRLAAGQPVRAAARRDPVWPAALALAVGGVVVAALAGGRVVATGAVCVAIVALTLLRVVRGGLAARTRRRRRAEVALAGETLAGLLRLGHVPARALAIAAEECTVLREAAAAQGVGADVADTLAKASSQPGLDELAQIAAGWRIATATGASMASTMDAVAVRLRGEQQVSGVVRAELSAPRATGRLLAGLPVAGLLLGYLMGGDPLGFLTGTVLGEACLIAGVSLMCAGLLWTDRLADRAGGSA
ncbi:type II secretion system F family protein [Propionicicella superfundia]|uniref:type II secretion system F family protein n=1 Tax=Propionicicella superfundia TaxID=348582 RepID=UPI00041A0C62|nr:hypothetical protein [Propionicicella superfundia]